MKKIVLAVVLIAVMLVGFTGCDGLAGPKKGNDTPADGIDYTNYTGNDAALTVKNNTSKNMVLFKGVPSQNNILGGVKAGVTSGIKKTPGLFGTAQDYIVYAVTADNYIEYKDNLAALDTSPYTTFYAVYNTATTNENVYEISSLLGGKYKMIVNNGSQYNVEFRNKGTSGQTLAFSLAGTYETNFALAEGEYMLFPVFRKYDKTSGEIISTFPTYSSGKLSGEAKSFEFSLDNVTTEIQFNTKKWVDGIKFSPSAAYIKIINNADQGLQFFKSELATPEITSAGGKRVNTGKSLMYAINMQQLSSNKYEEEVIVSGYRVGTNRIDDIYLAGDAKTTTKYKAGYMYTYTISGDAETGYEVTPLLDEVTGELKAQEVDWSTL